MISLPVHLTVAALQFALQAASLPTLPECSSEIVTQFEAGNYNESVRAAEACWQTTPHPRLRYYAAQGQQQTERYGAALHSYLEYLRLANDDPELLQDAQRRVHELRALTTAVVFSITPVPRDTDVEPQIRLDKLDSGLPPLKVDLQHCEGSRGARTLRLERGVWQVEVTLPGFIIHKRLVRVDSLAETIEVAVELDPTVQPPVLPPAAPPPLFTKDPAPRARPLVYPAWQRRALLAETGTYGALAASLAVAGIATLGLAPRQDIELLSNADRIERDLQYRSIGAGLMGAAVGGSVVAVTRRFSSSPTPLLAELGIASAVMAGGWTLFGVTSARLRDRDSMNPDAAGNGGGRIAGSGLAGLGLAVVINTTTALIVQGIQKRRAAPTPRRNASRHSGIAPILAF